MPFETTYQDAEGGVITTYWGVVTDADLIESTKDKLASIDRFVSCRFALTDLSAVERFEVTAKALQRNADIMDKVVQRSPDIVVAFVVPSDVLYGMGRMWQAYADRSGARSHVCRSRGEAEEWLRQTLAAAPPPPSGQLPDQN